jgi:hypothetical protein
MGARVLPPVRRSRRPAFLGLLGGAGVSMALLSVPGWDSPAWVIAVQLLAPIVAPCVGAALGGAVGLRLPAPSRRSHAWTTELAEAILVVVRAESRSGGGGTSGSTFPRTRTSRVLWRDPPAMLLRASGPSSGGRSAGTHAN